MNIKGKIKKVLPIASGTTKDGKLWRKQDILIETEERYPQSILIGIRDGMIDQYQVIEGERIEVDVNFRANEYNGKYYNTFTAWRIIRQ